jgi:hypothetical protein
MINDMFMANSFIADKFIADKFIADRFVDDVFCFQHSQTIQCGQPIAHIALEGVSW